MIGCEWLFLAEGFTGANPRGVWARVSSWLLFTQISRVGEHVFHRDSWVSREPPKSPMRQIQKKISMSHTRIGILSWEILWRLDVWDLDFFQRP